MSHTHIFSPLNYIGNGFIYPIPALPNNITNDFQFVITYDKPIPNIPNPQIIIHTRKIDQSLPQEN